MPDEPHNDDPLAGRDSQRWWDEQSKRDGARPSARRARPDDRDEFEERVYDDDDEPRSNPFAVWALVLGIVSLLCGIFSGIPAIILGALGMSRAKQLRGNGQGMSLAGIILGACSIGLTALSVLLLIPAVQKVRQAASNAMAQNNTMQIGIAMQDYESKHSLLPDPVYDPKKANLPNGKGLSWRVGLLPHLGEQNLHDSFALNQTWDSPANSPFSNRIVNSYTNPDEMTAQTRFQVFIGKNTFFDPGRPRLSLSSKAITDGVSNTILFAESGTPVPWASPQDMSYVPNGPLPPLGRPGESVFLVGMGDGTVRRVNKNVKPAILHAAIQINDGVPLPFDWFE
jgi:hypothetical protein